MSSKKEVTITLYSGDLPRLQREGWTLGAFWSDGYTSTSGYYLWRDEDDYIVRARVTPDSQDTIIDGDCPAGRHGPNEVYTAFLEQCVVAELDNEEE